MRNANGADAGQPSVLVRIQSLLPQLAPAERRVGQAALDDPSGTSASTIGQLARACKTSETTVLRFARAVGFSGYPDLRLALATATGRAAASGVAYVSGEILPDDAIGDVIQKIAAVDAEAVSATAEQLDARALGRVVRALQRARRIDLYGVGASAHVAQDLQQKLVRIGRAAFASPDPSVARSSATLLRRGDVAMAMSHSGATLDTLDCLALAKQAGATTIALTNYPHAPLTEHADLVLTTAVRETRLRSGAMASRIAQLSVVDMLFVLIARNDLPATMAAIERTYDAVRGRRAE